MNPTSTLIHRSLLQLTEADTGPSGAAIRRPFNPASPFDSSMALTILVLLTALFFLGFFSAYIRRFAAAAEDSSPTSSASLRRPPPCNRKGGLDISAVNSLPLVAYGKAARHPMIDDCPICLSEFFETETVKLIPYCSHVFHPRCIDTWLETHLTCPVCRSAQLFKSVEEVCLDVSQEKNEI
ncbi:hypothetical protein CDL12_29213 [Handroanthus impetiginosus]|uniref:RING-type E3 ubiquitin transferase n=1 Tax=Handroanthus impetiginosus TaxID=429701 RepID=A0A2G9FZ15_9LAMI|nr:hypothetical protein CDL12_29213 [Handroanthus impetiginosus]